MSAQVFEAFLARLYVDAEARSRFDRDPEGEAKRAGLGPEERRSLCRIDRLGLELAAASFASKRQRAETAARDGRGLAYRLLGRARASAKALTPRRPARGRPE